MSRESPEAAFEHARAAMARGDLPDVFSCLDVNDRGSISMRLFQQEQLIDVQVDGSRAWGTRVFGPGSSDDVEFVRRKGEWYIKLITRPRP